MQKSRRSWAGVRLLVAIAPAIALALNLGVWWGWSVAAVLMVAAVWSECRKRIDRQVTVALVSAIVAGSTLCNAAYTWAALAERMGDQYTKSQAMWLVAASAGGLAFAFGVIAVRRARDVRWFAWCAGTASVAGLATSALVLDMYPALVLAAVATGVGGVSTSPLATYLLAWVAPGDRNRANTTYFLVWALAVGGLFMLFSWTAQEGKLDIEGTLWLAAALTAAATSWVRPLPKDERKRDPRKRREIYRVLFRNLRESRKFRSGCLLSVVSGVHLQLFYGTFSAILTAPDHEQQGFGPWVGAGFLFAILVMYATQTALHGVRGFWIGTVQLALMGPIAYVWSATEAPLIGWGFVLLAVLVEYGTTALSKLITATLVDEGEDADIENAAQNAAKYGVSALLVLVASSLYATVGETGVLALWMLNGFVGLVGAAGATRVLRATSRRKVSRETWRLLAATTVTLAFAAVTWYAGIAGRSRMLLTEAGHMAADATVFTVLLVAMWLRMRGHHRADNAATLLGALVLLGLAGWNGAHGIEAFGQPPAADARLLVSLGGAALVVHALRSVLVPHVEHSHAGKLAKYEIYVDLLGAVLMIVAGALLAGDYYPKADAAATVVTAGVLAGWALVSIWGVIKHPVPVLKKAPRRVAERVNAELPEGLHTCHVWQVPGNRLLLEFDEPLPELLREELQRRFLVDDAGASRSGVPRNIAAHLRRRLGEYGVHSLECFRRRGGRVLVLAVLAAQPTRFPHHKVTLIYTVESK